MYLPNTNVLSDLNPDRPGPNQHLVDWLRRHGDLCYLSTVTLTEIAYGVAWPRSRGATARTARLGTWLEEIIRYHEARILPVDTDIALQAGVLLANARAAGVEPDTTDGWIGATAKVHGLEVLTFNMADFRPVVTRSPTHRRTERNRYAQTATYV
ncbi:MAG: PIN domain-containing protein [Rhodopila sp.]|nr:PIN domain-containing protein [Rhodopila sp.]